MPTVSYTPSFDFFGEIVLNATLVLMELSITGLCRLLPTAPPSHSEKFDPVRILSWNYLERLSYAQVESYKHVGLGSIVMAILPGT